MNAFSCTVNPSLCLSQLISENFLLISDLSEKIVCIFHLSCKDIDLFLRLICFTPNISNFLFECLQNFSVSIYLLNQSISHFLILSLILVCHLLFCLCCLELFYSIYQLQSFFLEIVCLIFKLIFCSLFLSCFGTDVCFCLFYIVLKFINLFI